MNRPLQKAVLTCARREPRLLVRLAKQTSGLSAARVMLGEFITARNSSSWWTSISLLRLVPSASTGGLARESATPVFALVRSAVHSALRTSACGKFQSPAIELQRTLWRGNLQVQEPGSPVLW